MIIYIVISHSYQSIVLYCIYILLLFVCCCLCDVTTKLTKRCDLTSGFRHIRFNILVYLFKKPPKQQHVFVVFVCSCTQYLQISVAPVYIGLLCPLHCRVSYRCIVSCWDATADSGPRINHRWRYKICRPQKYRLENPMNVIFLRNCFAFVANKERDVVPW